MVEAGPEALAGAVAEALKARRYDLAVAESCTGGTLAGAITSVAGASDYFRGGVVAYANQVKESVLGIAAEVIREYGAVSEPTARAMAEGVRQRLGAAVGVGITGVAGPGGGTATKPVGLVYVAVVTPDRTNVRRDVWPGDRAQVRAASVQGALELILSSVGGSLDL